MISGEGGYISGEITQTVYHGEIASTVVAIPFAGYKFIGWSDGVTEAERTDEPTSDIQVTAYFEKLPIDNVNDTAGVGGTISGNASQTVLGGESSETVVAIPDKGYKFVAWTDGVTTAERSDIASSDIEVSATFVPIPKYTVTYKDSEGGTVNGKLEQTAYEGESLETVVAVPDQGFEFVSWSDGVTEAERTDIATENKEAKTSISSQEQTNTELKFKKPPLNEA